VRQDLTDITVVMDRSGSMEACRTDAEGGLNQFVEDQKRQGGEALFTLVQFDHEYEFVHKGVPVRDVPRLTLVPRGSTALLDALGRAIVETGERLTAMPEADRPGLVVFVILTDGGENASREYTRAKVKEMVEHQQNAYKWKFTYLGANQDAFAEAGSIGIPMARSSTGYGVGSTQGGPGARLLEGLQSCGRPVRAGPKSTARTRTRSGKRSSKAKNLAPFS
jgi:hypothetical protein